MTTPFKISSLFYLPMMANGKAFFHAKSPYPLLLKVAVWYCAIDIDIIRDNDFRYKKAVAGPSYLYNDNVYIGKTASFYRNSPVTSTGRLNNKCLVFCERWIFLLRNSHWDMTPGSAFIKPDQLDPWIKDLIKITLLSTVSHLQLPNFVSCGRACPSHMKQNLVTVGAKLWTAEPFLVDPWSMD